MQYIVHYLLSSSMRYSLSQIIRRMVRQHSSGESIFIVIVSTGSLHAALLTVNLRLAL